VLHADVIVSTDSMKSMLQKAITGLDDKLTPTGNVVYHAVMHTNFMLADPKLCPFVEVPESTIWMCLNALLASTCPPLLDLGIHVIVKPDTALQSVHPLVRVPVFSLDWLVLELSHHCGAHCIVVHVLCGPIGQVEDLLVQPGGVLHCHCMQQPSLLGASSDYVSGFKFGKGE